MIGLFSHIRRESAALEFIRRSCGKYFNIEHNLNSYRSLEPTPWRSRAFLNNVFLIIFLGGSRSGRTFPMAAYF